MVDPKRGEIWRVDFEPVEGSEIGKLRPVIGDETLGRLPVRIVVPITGWDTRYRQYPWMTELGGTPVPACQKFQPQTLCKFAPFLCIGSRKSS